MSQNYILSLKKQFNQAVEKQIFQDVKAQLSQMNDARLVNELPTIGMMVVEVDNDTALKALENKHKDLFNFSPDGQRSL